MYNDLLNWTNGLDQTGWIAIGLFGIFAIIAIVTVVMIIKLRSASKQVKREKYKPLDELEETWNRPAQKKPVPEKPVPAKPASTKPAAAKPATPAPARQKAPANEEANPVEQAEIYLTYGLNQQAIDLLEKHLQQNPSDKKAAEVLTRAKS